MLHALDHTFSQRLAVKDWQSKIGSQRLADEEGRDFPMVRKRKIRAAPFEPRPAKARLPKHKSRRFALSAMRISNERTEWLARTVFPHEAAIRAWLRHRPALGLDIDDVIHDMYVKLIGLPSVEQIENPRRYAFRVVYAIVVDHVRHSKVVPISAIAEPSALEVAAPDPSIEERLSYRGDLADLNKVLATLSPLCREAFLLRRVDGLSQRETAARLSISEKTVEKYMTRAVRLIMDVFGRGGKSAANPSYKTRKPQSNDAGKRTAD
jgi:RNA polymerase sigma factor (sigma-70 family)